MDAAAAGRLCFLFGVGGCGAEHRCLFAVVLPCVHIRPIHPYSIQHLKLIITPKKCISGPSLLNIPGATPPLLSLPIKIHSDPRLFSCFVFKEVHGVSQPLRIGEFYLRLEGFEGAFGDVVLVELLGDVVAHFELYEVVALWVV